MILVSAEEPDVVPGEMQTQTFTQHRNPVIGRHFILSGASGSTLRLERKNDILGWSITA